MDLISRQAAIDAAGNTIPGGWFDMLYPKLEALPSAQPEEIALHESCTDCPLYDKDRHRCPRFNKVIPETLRELQSAQPEPREDAVSRRRLLSDLKELTAAWGKYPVMAEQIKGVETAIGYVETIPSVTPERPKGKWIPQDMNNKSYGMVSTAVYYYPKCSVCGWSANNTNFCPNCGADMRGGEDEA